MVQPVLSIRDLSVSFTTERGVVTPVDGVSFDVFSGKTLGIVGESGCGKSVTSLAIMRLIAASNGRIERGRILFRGEDILAWPEQQMRQFRGRRAAMIFQEPMTALNPVHRVGSQIAEAIRLHQKVGKKQAWQQAIAMLEKVKIPDPAARAHNYPHELSGGMRQRAMIAMALSCNPELLIADEPTTALDVTIQAQVLRLMRELQEELGTAIVFITHDLGVVAEVADDVMVMYAGKVVEQGSALEIFENPKHPYTRGLLATLPKLTDSKERRLLTIEGVVPSLHALPSGCRFAERCNVAEEQCWQTSPELVSLGNDRELRGRAAACHLIAREAVG